MAHYDAGLIRGVHLISLEKVFPRAFQFGVDAAFLYQPAAAPAKKKLNAKKQLAIFVNNLSFV